MSKYAWEQDSISDENYFRPDTTAQVVTVSDTRQSTIRGRHRTTATRMPISEATPGGVGLAK